tara:strand:- start:281 stop:436 length:156 start_codon:yes stop_codon:yes gene_type:complete
LNKKSLDNKPFTAKIGITMINSIVEDMPGLGIFNRACSPNNVNLLNIRRKQ